MLKSQVLSAHINAAFNNLSKAIIFRLSHVEFKDKITPL